MLKDKELSDLANNLVDLYQNIENDLLVSVAKKLMKYDSIGGSLEWQMKMLDELSMLNADNMKIISEYSKISIKELKKILKKASLSNVDLQYLDNAFKEGKATISSDILLNTKILDPIINNTFNEMDKVFKLINTNALEATKQAYMDIVNQSYLEVSSGIYSYSESVERGLKKFAEAGITGVTYKRKDGGIINYPLDSAIKRDTTTAVHKLANDSTLNVAKSSGCNHVEVSSHLGARISGDNPIANHAGWQGKVYQIEGESPEYGNLVKHTGYGDILGLAGVNCRHRMYLFWPGVTKPTMKVIDLQENEIEYKKRQKRNRLIRRRKDILNLISVYQETMNFKKVKEYKLKLESVNKELETYD